jgi:hypothetical protein
VRTGPEVELILSDGGEDADLERLGVICGRVEPSGVSEAVNPCLRVRLDVKIGRVLEVVKFVVICGTTVLGVHEKTR